MKDWIINLYVEGGPMDGEGFAVGPFALEEDAEVASETLAHKGQIQVLSLYRFPSELLMDLPE